MEIHEIKNFCEQLESLHQMRILEQKTDQEYYDDLFRVNIVEPFKIIRTGSAARVVDNIIAHIQGANVQVFREPKKNTAEARESAEKVARMLNVWVKNLSAEIDEAIRNAVLRGEFWFQVEYNKSAYDKKTFKHNPNQMPITITAPDPITLCGYPYDALYPEVVVKTFKVDYKLALTLFPELNGKIKQAGDQVEYRVFWDGANQYLEIGAISEDGVKKNPFGFCPFVHGYSGFGKRTYDGRPDKMAVGKLRKMRHTLVEDCELASRIGSILSLYANPLFVVQQTSVDADMTGREELEKTILGAGMTVTVPYGWKSEIYVPEVATAQLFNYYDKVQQRLGLDSPSIMSGVPNNSRTTGIQEDIEFGHVAKRYEKLIKNLEEALAAALSRSLEILYNVPMSLPLTFRATVVDKGQKITKEEQITKEDIDGYFGVTVKLNPDDSIENDRDFMKYRMLVNEGRIGWKEFLVKGCKMTEWEAEDTIAEALAERAVRDDPIMAAARTQEALEQMGMQRFVQKAEQEAEMQARMQGELGQYGQQQAANPSYRPPEVQNPVALQQVRQLMSGQSNAKGIRPSPQMSVPTGMTPQGGG